MSEIDLKQVLNMVLRKWWILFICIVVFGGAAYIRTNYYIVPIYSASTTLYVGKNVDQVGIQSSDLYLGSNLILDYREMAKSKLVAYEVMEELGITNMSAGSMAGRIGVTQRNETRFIQISVSDTDPKRAMDITNKVAEVFQKIVIEKMQVENVQIIDKAEMPMFPISPNNKRDTMIGIILGLAVGAGIIFLIEFLDNNIKTPEDVQKYVDLPVIGTIPVFQKGRRA